MRMRSAWKSLTGRRSAALQATLHSSLILYVLSFGSLGRIKLTSPFQFTWFEIDTLSGQTFGALLWVTPWFFQSSYCAYVCILAMFKIATYKC